MAPLRARHTALLACLLFAVCLLVSGVGAAPAGGASLEAKLSKARQEAEGAAAQLRDERARLLAVEGEASAAAAREEQLGGLLANGEERAAELNREVRGSQRRLATERAHLRRARKLLSDRLVAIYMGGMPSTVGVVLGASDYADLATRAGYLREIEEADNALASRVEQVRDEVHRDLVAVSALERRRVDHNERLAAARSAIGGVRERAQASAGELRAASDARAASLAKLRSQIDGWVAEVQAARAAAAEAASADAAEAEVGRWLGGPYSIPTYIVMCESGGDYGAVNPSSGAGGAYQILPSTWAGYGGKGAPQDAPKAEQDRIAAEIWADSGGGAWVCA